MKIVTQSTPPKLTPFGEIAVAKSSTVKGVTKSKRVSRRAGRRVLARREQLQETMRRTHESAMRWFRAHEASHGELGNGRTTTLGRIVEVKKVVPDAGRQVLVRWGNGVYSDTWIPVDLLSSNSDVTWLLATTKWNDSSTRVWTEERVLRVVSIADAFSDELVREYERYWEASRALDELSLTSLALIDTVD